jgi:hypothetical protein
MYCPICHKAYPKDAAECADCGVPLVESLEELEVLPEEFSDENLAFLPVLELQEPKEIQQAKAILDSRLIPYYIQEKRQMKRKSLSPSIFWIEKFYIGQAKACLKKFKPALLNIPQKK